MHCIASYATYTYTNTYTYTYTNTITYSYKQVRSVSKDLMARFAAKKNTTRK